MWTIRKNISWKFLVLSGTRLKHNFFLEKGGCSVNIIISYYYYVPSFISGTRIWLSSENCHDYIFWFVIYIWILYSFRVIITDNSCEITTPQFSMLHDFQFVNARRECKRWPYERSDLRNEPARWRYLLWALDLGLVLYKCLLLIPPLGMPIIGSNTLGSYPWMTLSSLKDRQYSYSSKWNNPDTSILVMKPGTGCPVT